MTTEMAHPEHSGTTDFESDEPMTHAESDEQTAQFQCSDTAAVADQEAPKKMRPWCELAGYIDHGDDESPNDYFPGGLHPVHLGDRLGHDGRYRVVHKLGHGGFGTVWLCHDKVTNKWRAVKIQAANVDIDNCKEMAMAEYLLSKFSREELQRNHISLHIESFLLDGPNGRHLCTVSPLLGPRLEYIHDYYAMCPPLLKHLSLQVVQGMRFLHSNSVCHGDLRVQNILLQLADGVDEMPEEELLSMLGHPETTDIFAETGELDHHIPKYLVTQTSIQFSSGLCAAKPLITDFGLAYQFDNVPGFTGIPHSYCSPEDMFGEIPMGPASDVWSLGTTIQEICCGFNVLEGHSVFETVDAMECLIGPVPHPYRRFWGVGGYEFSWRHDCDPEDESHYIHGTPWFIQQGYTRPDWFFSGDGSPRALFITHAQFDEILRQDFVLTGRIPGYHAPVESCRIPFEERIEFAPHLDDEDFNSLADLLKSIFRWFPKDRPTVEEIISHDFFKPAEQRQT